MAKRALYQLTERILAAATDIFHIGNSNKDYKITFANLCQYIWMYLTGTYFITQDVKNISAGDQVTNLSVYEAGGASEKPNGFRVKVQWTGGVGTFFHLWTGTGYTIDGVAIADFICAGTGFVILELDKTNGNWILVQDNRELIRARYHTSSTVGANTIINFTTKTDDNYAIVTTGASFKITSKKLATYIIRATIKTAGANNYIDLYLDGSFYERHGYETASGAFMSGVWIVSLPVESYVDIRCSVGSAADASGNISICELRI